MFSLVILGEQHTVLHDILPVQGGAPCRLRPTFPCLHVLAQNVAVGRHCLHRAGILD